MNQAGKRLAVTLLPLLMGVLAFLIVVGPRALNPMNIAWLDNGDPATHYLGWVFFRHAPWSFPLGLNPSYGLELGNAIVFSDSNPLFALLFKPFSAWLPEPFQYFGLWLLTCFVLQAWFAWKLMGLLTSNVALRLLGVGFFLFSPAMIVRMGMHLALAGHFLILAALYLALRPGTDRRRLYWGLLLTSAALIHAYLLAMAALIWMGDLLGRTLQRKLTPIAAGVEWLLLVLLVGVCCWQAGYFSVGSGVMSFGFGVYRANMLSFIDVNTWSCVLQDIPGVVGDGDGFAFLGLGVMFLAICALVVLLQGDRQVLGTVRKRPMLLLVLVGLMAFSLSNKVGVGPYEFTYPLPEWALALANVFRASGRMIWPMMYMATFVVLYVVVRGHRPRTAIYLLALALVIQVGDSRVGWDLTRKLLMVSPESKWKSPMKDPFWQQAALRYQNVRWLSPQNYSAHWLTLADYAGTHGLATNAVYLGRVDNQAQMAAQAEAQRTITSGIYDANTLYVLEERLVPQVAASLDRSAHVLAKIDGLNVLAPGWKQCADCPAVANAIDPLQLITEFKHGERQSFELGSPATVTLATGWSGNEPWGTWSLGHEAEIIFRPSAIVHSLVLEASALVGAMHPQQRVVISLNDVPVLSTRLTETDVSTLEIVLTPQAQAAIARQGYVRMRLQFADAASPQELGMSVDDRQMAMGLRALTVH
ncbi:DUF6311 domain-containing protein [Pseudomonas purpurea]|uniref:DUF6311 domain-containing protein n=1 Tax=Pseudomonas purpurea TaxID=3136737 RepID=UPI0032632BDF